MMLTATEDQRRQALREMTTRTVAEEAEMQALLDKSNAMPPTDPNAGFLASPPQPDHTSGYQPPPIDPIIQPVPPPTPWVNPIIPPDPPPKRNLWVEANQPAPSVPEPAPSYIPPDLPSKPWVSAETQYEAELNKELAEKERIQVEADQLDTLDRPVHDWRLDFLATKPPSYQAPLLPSHLAPPLTQVEADQLKTLLAKSDAYEAEQASGHVRGPAPALAKAAVIESLQHMAAIIGHAVAVMPMLGGLAPRVKQMSAAVERAVFHSSPPPEVPPPFV